MSNSLRFDDGQYEVKTRRLEERSVTYRAFEGLSYCRNPADAI